MLCMLYRKPKWIFECCLHTFTSCFSLFACLGLMGMVTKDDLKLLKTWQNFCILWRIRFDTALPLGSAEWTNCGGPGSNKMNALQKEKNSFLLSLISIIFNNRIIELFRLEGPQRSSSSSLPAMGRDITH